jgi:hypothetical protein
VTDMRVAVVVPAHDESALLPDCLAALRTATADVPARLTSSPTPAPTAPHASPPLVAPRWLWPPSAQKAAAAVRTSCTPTASNAGCTPGWGLSPGSLRVPCQITR